MGVLLKPNLFSSLVAPATAKRGMEKNCTASFIEGGGGEAIAERFPRMDGVVNVLSVEGLTREIYSDREATITVASERFSQLGVNRWRCLAYEACLSTDRTHTNPYDINWCLLEAEIDDNQ